MFFVFQSATTSPFTKTNNFVFYDPFHAWGLGGVASCDPPAIYVRYEIKILFGWFMYIIFKLS